jgi:hypothetical protein
MSAADGDDDHGDWCLCALKAYFHGRLQNGRPAFSGARFESLGDSDPNRVEPVDLVAVSLLGVDVSGHAAVQLLEHDAEQISELLTAIPADVDLHGAPERAVDHDSRAEDLWTLIRSGDGMGPTRTSKLLARKRPRLLPVYDSVVRDALGMTDAHDHWLELRTLLRDTPTVVELLHRCRTTAGLTERISLLRVLDVLLWMSDPLRRDL